MQAGTCDKLLCLSQVREVYERAIANVPPAPEKRYWQRYIYLWIRYALWEELEAEDAERTRQVYRACLNLIPHSIFTFAKVSPPRLGLQPPFIWAPKNRNLYSTHNEAPGAVDVLPWLCGLRCKPCLKATSQLRD